MQTNRPTVEKTRTRAYELYLQRGCQHGHDRSDWLQAEHELLQLPSHKIVQLQPPKPEKGRATTRLV
jgi:hypothetical protein